MISKRNFALVTAMMVILLFMFQATGVARDYFNDTSINNYTAETTRFGEDDAFDPEKGFELDEYSQFRLDKPEGASDYHATHIIFLGNSESSKVYDITYQWCAYTKRTISVSGNVTDLQGGDIDFSDIEAVVVDSNAYDISNNAVELTKLTDAGVNIIFANLPDAQVIKANQELQDLLGITEVKADEVEITGAVLFSDLFMGGSREYYYLEKDRDKEENIKRQDLDLNIPWYQVRSYAKSYMSGTRDDIGSAKDKTYTNEEAPQIIWRYTAHKGNVFVVNADYMDDITGIGILQGFMNDIHSYELYPIINAQNLSIVNYPSFANENREKMNEYYSRDLVSVYRDIVWQSLSTVTERTGFIMTSIISPQQDYSDDIEPDDINLSYFTKMLTEQNSEFGLSLVSHDEIPTSVKMQKDNSFLRDNFKSYQFQVAYLKEFSEDSVDTLNTNDILSNITTITSEYSEGDSLLSFEAGKLVQKSTNDAFSHTFRDDLRMRAIESTLGYTNIMMNLDRIAYPADENDAWNELYKEFANDTMSYWKDFDDLEKTTLSVSNVRTRRMMSTYAESYKTDDKIVINIPNHEVKSYLMLHIKGQIPKDSEGVTVTDMGEGYYLLTVTKAYVSVDLEEEYNTSFN